MSNLRKVNDDILKEWFKFREETCFCITDDEDKRHKINFEHKMCIKYKTVINNVYN